MILEKCLISCICPSFIKWWTICWLSITKKQRKATKKAHEKYQNLSKKEKEKNNNNIGAKNIAKKLPEHKKQKLVLSLGKNIIKFGKTLCNNWCLTSF